MKVVGVAESLSDRDRLKESERDLADRVDRRIAAFSGAWHTSDPLYQRLWFALTRVRREISTAQDALAPHFERADAVRVP